MQIEFVSSLALANGRWETDGVLVVMPFTDPAEARRNAQLMAKRAGTDGLILGIYDEGLPAGPGKGAKSGKSKAVAVSGEQPGNSAGFVALVNAAFRASTSPWIAYVAQDAFAGRSWLRIALTALQSKEGVLAAFNDGKWHGNLAAFGLARRAWINTLYGGDFFYPGYGRHYGDCELTVLAMAQQAFIYAPGSVLVELDWEKDSKAVNPADRQLYRERALNGFDGKVKDPGLLQRFQ